MRSRWRFAKSQRVKKYIAPPLLRQVFGSVLSALALLSGLPAYGGASLEVLPTTAPASTKPLIPWLHSATEPELNTDGLAVQLRSEDGVVRAEGHLLLTETAFNLSIAAKDAAHVVSRGGGNLWAGDSLQIALDVHGDAVGPGARDARGPFGPDDIAFGLALSKGGPEGWVFYRHRSSGRAGALPAAFLSAQRNAAQDITHYQLSLPWTFLGVQPGLNSEIGVALMLNDYTDLTAPPVRAFFGEGADGAPRPGLHARLRLPAPPTPVAAAQMLRAPHWSASEPAALQVAAGGPAALHLEVQLAGNPPVVVDVPSDGAIHRFRVQLDGLLDGDVPVSLRVTENQAPQPLLCEFNAAFLHPASRLQALDARINALLDDRAIHPLFSHHLRSIQALVFSEWAKLQLYRQSDPQLAESILQTIAGYTEALHGEVGEWPAYLDGRRSLLMAYRSKHDGTLQFYQLGLPADWQPERAYPLFFELHGAGDDNPLRFPSRRLSLTDAPPDLYGYTAPKTYAEIQRNGYWVHPFGRGNLGYRGIAEIDVLEAYDDAHARFNIDPMRRYLYGFSMGGGGTWHIAQRTPERWAAIAILAGAPRGEIGGDEVAQLRDLPIWIWCGEEDRLFPRTQAMLKALRAHGIEPVFSSSPGVGHRYLMEKQIEVLNWLQSHVRQ